MSKLFKKTREDLGKDIKVIASHTRIKESCLRAIEDEDYEKLPIEVYTRGYIKEYARYLGLPLESGIEPYERYLETKESAKQKKSSPTPEASEAAGKKEQNHVHEEKGAVCKEVKITTVKKRVEGEKSHSDSRYIWKGVLLLIVAAGIIYQFILSRNAEKEITIPPVQTQEQAPQAAVQPQPGPAVNPETTNTPAVEVKTQEAQLPARKKHVLEIAANDTAWVQVVTDGTTKREALMKQGDKATYEADETVRVVVGNAGGVVMKFDGRELPAGKKGEVLRISLPEKKSGVAQPENLINTQKSAASNHESGKIPRDNAAPSQDKPAGNSKP